MLGIGVGIDFALIFVKRFREELEKSGDDIVRVITKTMHTAGPLYFILSLTIMGSMAAILFVDISAVKIDCFRSYCCRVLPNVNEFELITCAIIYFRKESKCTESSVYANHI